MSDKKNETQEEGFRDLDFHKDFDANGNLKDGDMQKHFSDEREKLLSAPVGTGKAANAIPTAPPVIEKSAPDEKVEIREGDSADILAKRYSKKQLVERADSDEIEFKSNASNLSIAIEILKKYDADNPPETSSTVAPAAPEINDPKSVIPAPAEKKKG